MSSRQSRTNNLKENRFDSHQHINEHFQNLIFIQEGLQLGVNSFPPQGNFEIGLKSFNDEDVQILNREEHWFELSCQFCFCYISLFLCDYFSSLMVCTEN